MTVGQAGGSFPFRKAKPGQVSRLAGARGRIVKEPHAPPWVRVNRQIPSFISQGIVPVLHTQT